jgi:hypothetical protein
MPLLETFAEILCSEISMYSLQFLNCDDVIKSSSLQCQHGFMGMPGNKGAV